MPLRFKPWAPAGYATIPPTSLRLMVLGDSHHDAEVAGPDFTIQTVEAFIEDQVTEGEDRKWQAFFTKIQHAVQGGRGWIPPQKRAEFWNTVLFYNFFQESVDIRGQVQESTVETATAPFLDVIADNTPNRILVAGDRTWGVVKRLGTCSKLPSGCEVTTIDTGKSRVSALRITHPSGGLNYSETHPLVKEFLGATTYCS